MNKKIIFEDFNCIFENFEKRNFSGKTFLVTGANGMLGNYLIKLLLYLNDEKLEEKCRVIALCRSETKAKEVFKNYIERNDFILLIQDVECPIKYEGEVNYIIHAASQANTKRIIDDPVGTLSSNTIGTYNLLNYSINKKIEGFLFISSGAIYGNIDRFDSSEKIKEDEYFPIDHLQLKSSYSESKKMGENICYSFYKQYNIPTKIARIGHTYGPGINLNDGRVFSDFVKNILNTEDLVINSDGEDKRPFCYIADAVIALLKVLFVGALGEAYNIVNNDCHVSVNELAKILTEKVVKNYKANIIRKIQNKEEIKIIVDIKLSTKKINNLGWVPKIKLEEGFKRTIESFLEGDFYNGL